jgi:hypothetical protein
MTTAQDQIADIISESIHEDSGHIFGIDEAADAILAALPDMIAPLDFHESMQQASFANSAVGTYAYSPSRKIPGYVEMRIMGQRVLGNYPTEAEAIEKANADHRALIMAAFQTPTITP